MVTGVVLLGLLSVSFSMVSCAGAHHFFDVTGGLYVPSAAEHYEQALTQAVEWKGDAYLFSVTTYVASSSGATPTGGHLAYYFESASTPWSYLKLRLADGAWASEVNSKTSAETYPAIARENWVLDSVDAWSIALANGGEEFLVEHQEPLTSMAATLLHRTVGGQENVLVWEVDYTILFGPKLVLKIDPVSGEILEVKTR